MDGIHDMGGMHGLGRLEIEAAEPLFHHPWEARMLGMNLATTGAPGWNIDYSRFMREAMPADQYIALGYYAKWHYSRAAMLIEAGLLTAEELRTGAAAPGSVKRDDAMAPKRALEIALGDDDYSRPLDAPPRFSIGGRVRTQNHHPPGHTRLPRYARAKPGRIQRRHGGHVFPDTNAHGLGECPQHLYTVEFSARALWGNSAAAKDKVYLDLWESYLEPA